MHPAVSALLGSLSFGNKDETQRNLDNSNTVSRIAQVYEVARNALEYRAEHLVRRAAIERILRRKIIFSKNSEELSDELLTELKWAMYMTEVEEEKVKNADIKIILDKYLGVLQNNKFNRDWLLGLISSEIEERLNPNVDYQRFTTFAFNYFRQRVTIPDNENLDLVLYVAVDSTYSQSDHQQISYHIYKLVRSQALSDGRSEEDIFSEAFSAYSKAISSKSLNKLSAYLRRQIGPLVLLRDIYFSNPKAFKELIEEKTRFIEESKKTLDVQLLIMGNRMRNATVRSLIYVLSTKMIIAFLIELPLEKLLTGHVSFFSLGFNLLIPVLVMFALIVRTKLPNKVEQEKIIDKSWQVVNAFDLEAAPWEKFPQTDRSSKFMNSLFSGLYALLFLAIFAILMRGLIFIGFNVLNLIVFLFFLSVVSFFAFRIRQTAQVYLVKTKFANKSSFTDVLMLPIVVLGGWLSIGVSRLNFLVFIFDFILEAPFKIILRFVDNWTAFLSNRRDEVVG